MPKCGSQVTLCDVPIRFDTYEGCSHACSYCFVNRKNDISKIRLGESAHALERFIAGERNQLTSFCDWDIPLHWGGMSDPFQPAERIHKRSLECLEVFARTGYPFIVSTKNKMIAEGEYLELIKKCNCVVQFSALSPRYDAWEKGASTFDERMQAAKAISPYKRVIIRCQPYIPQLRYEMIDSLRRFRDAGAYGVIFESMKAQKAFPQMIKLNNDCVYPVNLLREHFEVFRDECHRLGMKFYCGENRLRAMGDSLCCCGIDGLGWRANTANLNHFLYDKDNFVFTDKMKEVGTAHAFKATSQSSLVNTGGSMFSFERFMTMASQTRSMLKPLIPKDIK